MIVLRITCRARSWARLEIIALNPRQGLLQAIYAVGKTATSWFVGMRCGRGTLKGVGVVCDSRLGRWTRGLDQRCAGFVVWNVALSGVGKERENGCDFLRRSRLASGDGDEELH